MNDTSAAITRLLLVDDHPLVRDGLRARLEAVRDFVVVGEAGNAQEALALAAAETPHLVLMDVGMNGMNGIALAGLFHERFPAIRVLMLSMHDNLEYVTQAVRAGASGYVLKDSPATEIIQAIGAVLDGKTFFQRRTGRAADSGVGDASAYRTSDAARARHSRCVGRRLVEQADRPT